MKGGGGVIDLREIYDTIDELRRKGTTVGQAEKLALLYIAADYMEREERQQNAQSYAHAAAPNPAKEMPVLVTTRGTSEFLTTCNGVPVEAVLKILDEHMEAIRVLYPKEFEAIMHRLEEEKEG